MDWTDLYLRTQTADDLRAACPFLVGHDEKGAPFWIMQTDEWGLDIIGPVVTKQAAIDVAGNETSAAEIDHRFHANLRCTVAIAARVPMEIRTNPETPGRVFAGDPPKAAPQPVVSLTVGMLWDRLDDGEWDALDTAMSKEHRRLQGLWNNTSHLMTEGENLWNVIAGHLDKIVSAERKAELLARPTQPASAPADDSAA